MPVCSEPIDTHATPNIWREITEGWRPQGNARGAVDPLVVEIRGLVAAATAIVAASMGRVARFHNGRLRSVPWADDVKSEMDGMVADWVGCVAGNGSAHAGRRRRNIEAVLRLERHVTELWALRGVTWELAKAG